MATYWYVTITDSYTGEQKYLRAPTKQELEIKKRRQFEIWEKRAERLQRMQTIEELSLETDRLNSELSSRIEKLKGIINHSTYKKIDVNSYFNSLEQKYVKGTFKCSKSEPNKEQINEELGLTPPTIFSKIVEAFSSSRAEYRQNLEIEAAALYNKRMTEYNTLRDKEEQKFEQEELLRKQQIEQQNLLLADRKKDYFVGQEHEVESYVKHLLENLIYCNELESYLLDYEIQYNKDAKLLIVSRKLPSPDYLPQQSSYKFIKSRQAIEPVKWKDKDKKDLYDAIIFQIVLKTIADIFSFVDKEILEEIVFNGWVDYIDTSNGKDTTACIISLQTARDVFQQINLTRVDFRECIKGLKGLFDTKISNLTPVAPILNLNRNDARFINSKEVSDILIDGFNLATMEWEDFEYLVRELFSKIFGSENSEVKVTQASKDGGVDAIAFDPDPIRGGKFVIQAKRYNIVVPVSAVRDLYGTMIHEGASKGILVTTSNYGTDSYEFIKDKPITLINGQELLGLMQQYGYDKVTIKLNKK